MNPLEEVFHDLQALHPTYEDSCDLYEQGIGAGLLMALESLGDVLAQYRPVPGPPTEPGDWWIQPKANPKPFVIYVSSIENSGIVMTELLDTFGDYLSFSPGEIEWHAKVMPVTGGEQE